MNEAEMARIEPGCVEEVAGMLDALDAGSVFLAADRQAYEASGARAALEPQVADREVVLFDAFSPNPKYQDVTRGVALFRDRPCDVVIAVGGGSALDMGKLIGFCAAQPEAPVVVLTNQAPIRYRPRPLIAIPTTAGTGSEATHFAEVSVDGRKHVVSHQWLLPTHALVDPELTANLPAEMTAQMGLGVLCLAMTSMWSAYSTGQSLAYAREALGLVRDHLEKAVRAPTPGARWALCRAAHLAGRAVHIGGTGAPHAISFALITRFGMSYGLAAALTLGATAAFVDGVTSADVADSRGAGFVRARVREVCDVLRVADADALRGWIEDLMRAVGCPTRLHEAAVTADDVAMIVAGVQNDASVNNPRRMTQTSLHEVLLAVL